MIQQSSSLVLKHSDISSTKNAQTASSSAGDWTNYKQSTRFRVDLRTAIGQEIYSKHDRFILRLNCISWTSANSTLAAQDRQVVVRLSGLPWINSSYSCATGTNRAFYDACVINLVPDEARTLYFTPNISMAQFGKVDQATIQVELIRTIDGVASAYGGVDSFPHMCMHFDIYPVKEGM